MIISLNKQVHIYSVDTSDFYNQSELKIHNRLNKLHRYDTKLRKYKLKITKQKQHDPIIEQKIEEYIKNTHRRLKKTKDKLYKEFTSNSCIRHLNKDALNKKNIVSVFDSVLTRTMQIPESTLNTDIIIVQTYFFDVIEDIILDGFLYNNEKYICFTASAGQIRTKKTVFIKENVLLKYQKSLMCGLTIEDINNYGGVNINKFLAYLALCNSATDLWEDFDITKSIVVDDMETTVRGLVDFIDDKTYEIKRQEMDVLINHTDGCGMILPRKSKKNMMVRLPWIKGLLVPFPYDDFIRDANEKSKGTYYGMVTDIYGKKHDILKEDIEIIFTKSQFKMWKYYISWNHYMNNFIKYNCQAGKCNEEEDVFSDAKLNYQMLQSLTDIRDGELKTICSRTIKNIVNIGKDRKTMLKVLGVTQSNVNKNYYQQALEIYPELLGDTYSREILKQVKKSLVKEGRSAKLDINGKYTFLCPDLYAFCEYLIFGNKNPNGLLKNNEVYCNLYKDEPKLDCLRSPHLYREHAVRNNVVDSEKSRWFITNGIYTSSHDLISKILQFDNDGDKSLVCADHTVIKVAERNMQNIVPLYYNMAKAGATQINNQNIYNGLKSAYTGGNIGMISNDITKIWNSDNVDLDVIKLLCMENNFIIDFAKTLYKPERPKDKKDMITDYTKLKTPHFFIYAKNKTKDKVEKINNSVVNRLEKIIPNTRINFNAANLGKFDYTMLMRNKHIELHNDIINKYKELDLKKRFIEFETDDSDSNDNLYIYKDIRNKILEINSDVYYVTDVLIEYLYKFKSSNYKTTLWSSFGDIIIENLRYNVITNQIYCENCGTLVNQSTNNKKYCEDCAREINIKKTIENRKKRKLFEAENR